MTKCIIVAFNIHSFLSSTNRRSRLTFPRWTPKDTFMYLYNAGIKQKVKRCILQSAKQACRQSVSQPSRHAGRQTDYTQSVRQLGRLLFSQPDRQVGRQVGRQTKNACRETNMRHALR